MKSIKNIFLGIFVLVSGLSWSSQSHALFFKGLRTSLSSFWRRTRAPRQEATFNKIKTDYDFFRKNPDGSTTFFSRTKWNYSVTKSTSGFTMPGQDNQTPTFYGSEPTSSHNQKPVAFIDADFRVLDKIEAGIRPLGSSSRAGWRTQIFALFKKK